MRYILNDHSAHCDNTAQCNNTQQHRTTHTLNVVCVYYYETAIGNAFRISCKVRMWPRQCDPRPTSDHRMGGRSTRGHCENALPKHSGGFNLGQWPRSRSAIRPDRTAANRGSAYAPLGRTRVGGPLGRMGMAHGPGPHRNGLWATPADSGPLGKWPGTKSDCFNQLDTGQSTSRASLQQKCNLYRLGHYMVAIFKSTSHR